MASDSTQNQPITMNMTQKFDYDMVVIGSGPGGQRAAIQAVKLGKRAAIVDANPQVGGVCLHDGTIPSKAFREAILHLSGYRERGHYGKAYRVKQDILMHDLTDRVQRIGSEIEQTIRSQLIRNQAEIIKGKASFIDAHHILVLSLIHI